MNDYATIEQQLKARLADIVARSEEIEEDLRSPLDADFAEQDGVKSEDDKPVADEPKNN